MTQALARVFGVFFPLVGVRYQPVFVSVYI